MTLDTSISTADVADGINSVAEVADGIRNGRLSAVGVVEELFARADKLDPLLGVYLARFDEEARASVIAADKAVIDGDPLGPLHGVPIAIKDIITTVEGPTTAQSLVLPPSWGGRSDAPVVERLRAAGAVIIGKTTTMEFAIGLPDPSKPFPIPRNPWDKDRWTGGSSSGTGAGVAAGLFPAGLGTDTGGSVRIPAAYCGITGLKPTYGLVPKSGCVPLGFSLDHIGPMAHSAYDCAILLSVMAGYHASDPTSVHRPKKDYTSELTGDLDGMRIGVERSIAARTPGADPSLDPAFDEAVSHLMDAGATLVEIEVPSYEALVAIDMVLMTSEAFSYHAPWLKDRWHDYGRYTREFVALGALLSGGDYVAAQRARRYVAMQLQRSFDLVDAIVMPTASTGAPKYELLWESGLGNVMGTLFTGAWNSSALPVVAAPMGFTDLNLPLSIQVIGKPFHDGEVLRVADALQRRSDFHRRQPELALQC